MAEKFVFSNFAVSTLTQAIDGAATSLSINVDDAWKFPILSGGSKFPIVLADSDDNVEIIYVVALNVAGEAQIERGREGTIAQSWLAGTLVRHTFTAATVVAAAGFTPKGNWSNIVPYEPGDVVAHGGVSYVAVLSSLNSVPSNVSVDWQVIYQPPGAATTALNYQGRYNSGTTYDAGNVVEHKGRIWQSNADGTVGQEPVFGGTYWTHLARWSGSASHEDILAFSGTNNYTVTIAANEGAPALYDGMVIQGRFANVNSGNATLTINALPPTPLRHSVGVDFAAGDLVPTEIYKFVYRAGTSEFVSYQPPGLAADLAQIRAQLASATVIPVGVVIPYAGAAAPAGWLSAQGQAVSRVTYAALFAVIGATYGAGDGSTTFNLPDLRGRVAAGPDLSSGRLFALGVGSATGASQHTLAHGEMPVHNHGVTDGGHSHGVSDPTHTHSYNDQQNNISGRTTSGGVTSLTDGPLDTARTTAAASTGIAIQAALTGIAIQNAGGGVAHNNTQPTLVLNQIIFTGVI